MNIPELIKNRRHVVVDGPLDADFALHVHGDSMQPNYLDGDLVFLRSVPDVPHNGSVCAVSVDAAC